MGHKIYLLVIGQIYDDYLSQVARLEAEHRPTDGLLGFGRRPDSDPCHDRFVERLRQTLDDVAAGVPSSRTVYEVLRFVYSAPAVYKDSALACWMLLAVHGLTDSLIGFLSSEDASDLASWYTEAYPRHVRLPAQERIAMRLQMQAYGNASEKEKSLPRLFGGRRGGGKRE